MRRDSLGGASGIGPAAPAFTLPPAVWLPKTSWWPFSFILIILMLLLNGAYVGAHFFLEDKLKWWMTAGWLGVVSIVVPIFVEVVFVRRVNLLSAVVQQDPRLVAGDAVAFGLLRQMPCCMRCREADTLQKSLVNLYRASFRSGSGSVVYDGGFSRRSVISCGDLDGSGSAANKNDVGAISDFSDYDSENGGAGWETPPDPALFAGDGRSAANFSGGGLSGSLMPSSFDAMNHSAGINMSQQQQSVGGAGESRRTGLRLGGHNNSAAVAGPAAAAVYGAGGSNSLSLQRALLLSGVSSAEAAAAGVGAGSNPNTPRGDGGGGMSYGSTAASSMVSARSSRSLVSNNNNNSSGALSPPGFELHSFRGNPLEKSPEQDKHPYLAYDPLADNNSTSGFDELMRGVPDTGTSLLVSLVKQISPGTPLSSVTFPVHILEPRSLLEKFADVFRHASILVEAAAEPDPDIRIRHVAKFFLSAYYLQQGARKPYNPIHGECFAARLEIPSSGGRIVSFLAEQVSHHPPVTFIRAVCAGVFSYRAVYHANTSLVSINCASSIGEGGIEIELFPPRASASNAGGGGGAAVAAAAASSSARSYKYSTNCWPTLFVSGFLYGSMRLELGGTSIIKEEQAAKNHGSSSSNSSNSNAKARVDFARKGWISGEYDVVRVLFADGQTGVLDEKRGPVLDGKWNATIYFSPDVSQLATNKGPVWNGPSQRHAMARLVAVDAKACPARQSRAVWQRLTAALRQQQVPRAVEAKHEVEQAQRAWRTALAARNERHLPIHFAHRYQQQPAPPSKEMLWDLSLWSDTDAAKEFFASQVADVEIR